MAGESNRDQCAKECNGCSTCSSSPYEYSQHKKVTVIVFKTQQEIWKYVADGGAVISAGGYLVKFKDGELSSCVDFSDPDEWVPFFEPKLKTKVWREWWILNEISSNRCLIRDDSEKWPDDVAGKPSKDWSHVIEAAPALAEIERLRAENAILRDELIHTSGNLRLLGLSGMAAKINEALTHYEQFKKESAK